MRTIRIALVAGLVVPFSIEAQIRASELAVMSQTIDGTVIKVEYSRPRARGRDPIFGTKAVTWGETWTPGANWATTLETNRPIKLDGHAVAPGKYSVWMVVRKDADWTLVLEQNNHIYHMNPPESTATQVRVPVRVQSIPFTDVLTWSMPELRMDGGKLAMDWERVRIAVDVKVEPSMVMTFPAAESGQYAGEYSFVEKDSTGKNKISLFTISHEDGMLKGRWTPDDPYMKKFALIRVAPDSFVPGVYDKSGVLYEVLRPDLIVDFKRENGRVVSFTIRDMADELWGTGTRKR
jgi:hypothetical protein